MNTYQLHTKYKKILADTITPVSLYLKLRDHYPNSIMLESSDYHANQNSFSYICCKPIASIQVNDLTVSTKYPDGSTNQITVQHPKQVVDEIHQFSQQFKTKKLDFPFITNGLFGYINYDAVEYFEDIQLQHKNNQVPSIYYSVYQYVIAINHFKNEAYIFSHASNPNQDLQAILNVIHSKPTAKFSFSTTSKIQSNFSDAEYEALVTKAKSHCQRGDVFQLVLSREFTQQFKGDDFNVYRALRSINPSPYLFYYDYGNFKIFGSSPEAQLVIQDNIAEIHPIAGTFKRTGNDEQDVILAKQLEDDPKENSEHVMLVDLARNDLSRNTTNVQVETYKEVQFFSHVIHLVSKVTGQTHANKPSMQVVADTFPAGTLSGAPKHKAMQLIDQYETKARGYYGGAIGFMDFNGNFNHAIMIRSFFSQNQTLTWRAGAGIVAQSSEKNEQQEVHNKLNALTQAIKLSETI